jgi:hypothetical protein
MPKTSGDWLERNHGSLYIQANTTVAYLTPAILTKIGITGNALEWYNTVFIPKHTAFNAAYDDWVIEPDRTIGKTTTLFTAEKEFEVAYRTLYKAYLRDNPLVSDTDLVEMRLPKRPSGAKSSITKLENEIETTADTAVIGKIGLHYKEKNKIGIAKPKHVHGAEIRWGILDNSPKDVSELRHSSFSTRTPAILSFSGNERGKTVYYALRWESNTGLKGPWSAIYNSIIP